MVLILDAWSSLIKYGTRGAVVFLVGTIQCHGDGARGEDPHPEQGCRVSLAGPFCCTIKDSWSQSFDLDGTGRDYSKLYSIQYP